MSINQQEKVNEKKRSEGHLEARGFGTPFVWRLSAGRELMGDFFIHAVMPQLITHSGHVQELEGHMEPLVEEDEHEHYSQRSPWLRAFVLGALDGLVSPCRRSPCCIAGFAAIPCNRGFAHHDPRLCASPQVSVACTILGVSGGNDSLSLMRLAGVGCGGSGQCLTASSTGTS